MVKDPIKEFLNIIKSNLDNIDKNLSSKRFPVDGQGLKNDIQKILQFINEIKSLALKIEVKAIRDSYFDLCGDMKLIAYRMKNIIGSRKELNPNIIGALRKQLNELRTLV